MPSQWDLARARLSGSSSKAIKLARRVARRVLRRGASSGNPSTRRFALTVPVGEGFRELTVEAPWSGYIARELARTGLSGYEHDSLAAMLAGADLAGDGAIFDVGANIGVFALLAGASTSRRVIAFEPMPGLAATARAAVESNGLREVTVEQVALAAAAGSATFYASAVSDASNSLNPAHRAHSHSFEVVLETLDGYVLRTGLVPVMIKIDTETTEPDVIRGGLGALARERPWVICEVLGSGRPDELADLMAPLGYHYYRISSEPRWIVADRPRPITEGKFFNWLFAPEPLDEAFWERLDLWRERLAACGSRTLS